MDLSHHHHYRRISDIGRAVASLEEAEGHQHLAGGHGGGCEQMSPLPARGSRVVTLIFCIFLIQNPAFWCILGSENGHYTSVFIKTPMHWGKRRLLEEAAE